MFQYLALFALGFALNGCTLAHRPDAPAHAPLPAVLDIPLEKPWSVSAVVTDSGAALLAATSHTKGLLEIWQVTSSRQPLRLASDDRAGFHPDGVRWISPTELLVAGEGTGKIQHFSFVDNKLKLLQSIPSGNAPFDMVAGDLDGDGNLDIVSGPYSGDKLSLLWGQADGKYHQEFLATEAVPLHPRLSDWDRDGKTDIVWANRTTGSVQLAHNLGQRKFEVRTLHPRGPGHPREVTVGDIDNDGFPDLVISQEAGKPAIIMFNDGKGGVRPEQVEIPAPIFGYRSAAITRVQNSPMLALGEEGMIVLARPRGNDLLHTSWERRKLPAGSMALDVQFIDLDRDGEMDLVFTNSGSGSVQVIFGPLWEQAEPLS